MPQSIRTWNELVKLLDLEPGPGTLQSAALLCRETSLEADRLLDGSDLFYLRLRLDAAELHLRAVGANDETVVAPAPPWTPKATHDLTTSPPWSNLAGKFLSRAWRLFNDRGYADGISLEFGLDGEQSRVLVETSASSFRVSVVESRSLF